MPAIERLSRHYAILGEHGSEVQTVEGSVARVRMFVRDRVIDEDFPLPAPITVEQQLHEMIMARIAELEGANG